MHKLAPSKPARQRQSGFSLPEVAMAIGIIAVAFVALISLIPIGLNTYRASMDEANQTWIMQGVNAMVQTTDFSKIKDQLDYQRNPVTYYFDEEGRLVDREGPNVPASTDVNVLNSRIYAVKLLVDELLRPGEEQVAAKHGYRILIVMATLASPKAMGEFADLNDIDQLDNLPKNSLLRTRTIFAARMDSEPRVATSNP
jgi:uncharacterized protein (TIGR02598 family)